VIFAEPQEHVSRINEELAAGSPQVTGMDAEGHKLATDAGVGGGQTRSCHSPFFDADPKAAKVPVSIPKR
jgi:hypothetical protein